MHSLSYRKSRWSKGLQWENDCGSFFTTFSTSGASIQLRATINPYALGWPNNSHVHIMWTKVLFVKVVVVNLQPLTFKCLKSQKVVVRVFQGHLSYSETTSFSFSFWFVILFLPLLIDEILHHLEQKGFMNTSKIRILKWLKAWIFFCYKDYYFR